MKDFNFEGFNKTIEELQNAAKGLNINPPDLGMMEKSPSDLLKELKSELIQLQKIQKEKDWVQKHPFWFGTIMAAIGAIFGALATLGIQLITQ